MEPRKKILFLCSWFRDHPDSSSGVFFAEQASVFVEHGHDVAIACCARQRSLRNLWSLRPMSISRKEYFSGDVRGSVYRGEIGVLPPRFRHLNGWLRRKQFAWFLRRIYADFGRPDVVHIQSALDAGIFGFEALVSQNIPYVITEHASAFRRGLVPDWKKPLVKSCFAHASAAFAVSTPLIEDLRQTGITAAIEVLPNMYDDNLFNIDNVARDSVFTFLMVCSLRDSVKGTSDALRAFAKAKSNLTDCRLIIAGDGPDAGITEQLVDELAIRPYVELLGHQTRHQIAALMKKAHCILSASRVETFGITLIEGLASGLAALATRSGGPEEFVQPPHGILAPASNPTALAEAMITMCRTYDGSGAALAARNQYVRERFSRSVFYRSAWAAYDKVSGSDGGEQHSRANN